MLAVWIDIFVTAILAGFVLYLCRMVWTQSDILESVVNAQGLFAPVVKQIGERFEDLVDSKEALVKINADHEAQIEKMTEHDLRFDALEDTLQRIEARLNAQS